MGEMFRDSREPVCSRKAPLPKSSASVDLSRQIEQMVERRAVDTVRCVHVFGDFYRCNWWSRRGNRPDGRNYDWAGLMTDHVRQSRFFRATVSGEDVVLEEVLAD